MKFNEIVDATEVEDGFYHEASKGKLLIRRSLSAFTWGKENVAVAAWITAALTLTTLLYLIFSNGKPHITKNYNNYHYETTYMYPPDGTMFRKKTMNDYLPVE